MTSLSLSLAVTFIISNRFRVVSLSIASTLLITLYVNEASSIPPQGISKVSPAMASHKRYSLHSNMAGASSLASFEQRSEEHEMFPK